MEHLRARKLAKIVKRRMRKTASVMQMRRLRLSGQGGRAQPSQYEHLVAEMNLLKDLGDKHQPSKRGHNYLPYYWMHLRDVRESVQNVLEIGVQTDASLKLWEEFFPNATIHGLDIDARCSEFAGGRRVVHIGDQGDADTLRRVAAACNGPLDIIIDDGSHRISDQLTSFDVLFPLLSNHGVYVLEDTGGVVGDYGLVVVKTLQKLISNVMYWPIEHDPQDWPTLSEFGPDATWADKNITGIAFYRWIVFVMRGNNPSDNSYLRFSERK